MRGGVGWGGVGMGRDGSKMCKPIPAPPRGVGLNSCPIPAPSPLRGGENPHGAKRGGAKLPSLVGLVEWVGWVESLLSPNCMIVFTRVV